MDEDFPELQHPLPAPPAHFANYTDHNLALLALIRQRVPPPESFQSSVPSTSDSSVQDPKEASPSLLPRLPPPLPPIDLQTQIDLLKDETDVPSWPLTDLDPPRVDWILEDDGIFSVFGQTLKVDILHDPSLGEAGGTQLFPADRTVDRRPALTTVLKSLLVAYSKLTQSLLAPPPPPPPNPGSDVPPEWMAHQDWIRILAENLMAAANDMRPVQAKVNLEAMMRTQLQQRKDETVEIHQKCDALETRLAELKAEMASLSAGRSIEGFDGKVDSMTGLKTSSTSTKEPESSNPLTMEDVLRWAEEIG